jgi:beta-glucosidase
MDVADGLMGGSDIWDSPMPQIHTTQANELYSNDAYMITEMREAMHHILYTVVNSNAMNGWTDESYLTDNTPWWEMALNIVRVATAVLAVVSIAMLIRAIVLKKKTSKE